MVAVSSSDSFHDEYPFRRLAEDDDDDSLYGTAEELYASMLSELGKRYLGDRYALCLEIRDGDRVVHAFPKVACPALILEQLHLKRV